MRLTLTTLLLAILAGFLLIDDVSAQPAQANGRDAYSLIPVQPSSDVYRERELRICDLEFRAFDGTCTTYGDNKWDTNKQKLFGSTNRPLFSYFVHDNNMEIESTADQLASPRLISNKLCQQSLNIFDERYLNEFSVFFGQFLDHTIVSTSVSPEEPMPINIPKDDPVFGNFSKGQLPFFRSKRVRVKEHDMMERPQNTLTSAIDLVSVYGPSAERNSALRANHSGLMKTSPGAMLPVNVKALNNAPRAGADFFIAGDHRANEHPMLMALHTLFLREHNSIARELKRKFPMWGDERLFQMARKINGAQMQKVVFEEWYPAMTGRKLPRYKGFKTSVDPTISVLFSTAAFRVGHTMVGNRVNRRGKDHEALRPLPLKSMFFQPVGVMRAHGIEEFLRGALHYRAQKVDLNVRDALRNFLFTGVRGEIGLDLVAMNLQRGRDHRLPSYNAIRVRFGFPKVTSFREITSNVNVQSALQSVYGSVVHVEAWIGLVAEDHAPRSSMGPTMIEIWKREFMRLRDGDSFYYRTARGGFPTSVQKKIPRVQALYTRESCMKDILLRNSDITEQELPRNMFFKR